MTDTSHIEVLRAALRYIEHTANGKQELLVEQMRNAIRALSPAGGGEAKLLERARAAVRVLRTILHKGNLRTGAEVSEQLLADLENALAASPQQEPGAGGDADESVASRQEGLTDAQRLQDYPTLLAFYQKHALVPLASPSCLCCGQSTQGREVAIRHMELPCVVICADCRPDPKAQDPSGQTLAGAGGVLGEIDWLWSLIQEARVSYSADHASGTFRICGDRLSKIRDSVATLTATSAGTTGDDSEDAARLAEAMAQRDTLDACGCGCSRKCCPSCGEEILGPLSWLDPNDPTARAARRARGDGK